MDALLAYGSDASGGESDGSGEEQASAVAADTLEDLEATEHRLLELESGCSEGGVLSFLASCPPWTKLKMHRKFLQAAELEEVWCEGEESEYVNHFLTRDLHGRVGTRDDQGKWSINDEMRCWWLPTFTHLGDLNFSHGDLVAMFVQMFSAVSQMFICQEQPGVWVICDAADFMALAEPRICCLSQIHVEAHQYLSVPESVSAALNIELCMPDDGEAVEYDYPCVVEIDAESECCEVRIEHKLGTKVQGHFVGTGEKLGDWDIYTDFEAAGDAPLGARKWLSCGMCVTTPGTTSSDVVLVHLLSGRKRGGAGGRQHNVYFCLLYVTGMHADKSPWMYATLPNVEPTYKIPSETTLTIVEVAKDTLAIATVSAATQQASKALPKKRKAA